MSSPIVGDFTGKDLIVTWTRNANNAAEPDLVFKDYEVDFVVNDIVKRTLHVKPTTATYYFDDMVADQGTNTPSRTVSVRVRERDTFLRQSASGLGTFTNPRPAAVSFQAQPFLAPSDATTGTILISITPVQDADLVGYMIFRGNSAGFTPSGGNRIYMGTDTSYFDNTVNTTQTYYYKVAAYDRFNSAIADLNFGAAVSAKGTFALEMADIKFFDITFTPNADGVANRLRWTAGTATRTLFGANTSTSKSVSGSFINSGTTERYVYFDWDLGVMASNTSILTALGKANNRILATYRGGTDLIEGVNEPIIDGSKILAHTIGSSQLITTDAIITGTAQIANTIITDAHILNVSAAKITTGFLDADRIQAGTITTGHMAANTINANRLIAGSITGDRIVAKAITTGHMTVNSIDGDRITAGTLHANRITANTITATQLIKTQALITETAQLESAVIRTAHIGDLQVDTIKIKNDAIGRTFSAVSSTRKNLSTNIEYDAARFTIPAGVSGKLFITGHWWWEADDDPDVRYRLIRTRAGTAAALFSSHITGGHGEIGVSFSASAVTTVTAGDVISVRLTKTSGGGCEHFFSQVTGILTMR